MNLISKVCRNIYLFGFLFVCVLPFSANAQSFTLEDAVETALKNNVKIKQYQEKLLQKKYQDLEAWGNFMPQVELQGSYTHLNDPMSIDLNPIRAAMIGLNANVMTQLEYIKNPQLDPKMQGMIKNQITAKLEGSIPTFVETFKKQDYKTATLTAVQPIFTGGKLYAAKKFASDDRQSSEIELVSASNETVQETVNNYLAVVLLQNIVKTRRDVLEGINRHKSDAEKLYKQGLIANYHLLRAEVAVADAERNLSDDINKLELSLIALKNTLGIAEDQPLQITDTLIYSAIKDSIASFQESALMNQPLLRLIDKKKSAASDKYIAERAGLFPTLAAFGKYEMYPEYLSSLEPRWAVGLQLRLNLFNGFRDYSRIQTAVHLKREVNYIEADAKKKINLWVNKSYRDVNNARIRYQKLDRTIALAKENLRLNEKRFQSGMGTSLEVIDAQLSLEKNEIESLNSLYDYYKALTDLYTAAGNPQEILNVWHKEK